MGFQSKYVSETIVDVKNVTVNFSGFKALNELNFSIERGELRVVIGPNGAGKTTLLDVITAKVKPTAGQVVFQPNEKPTCDITGSNEAEVARLGIGRKFQTPNVFKSLTVLDNLKLSLKYPRGVWHTLLAPFLQDGTDRVQEILGIIGLRAK